MDDGIQAPDPQPGSSGVVQAPASQDSGAVAEDADPDSGMQVDEDEEAEVEGLTQEFQTQRLGGDVGTSAHFSDGVYR